MKTLLLSAALLCSASAASAAQIDSAYCDRAFGLVGDQIAADSVPNADQYFFQFSQNGNVVGTVTSPGRNPLLSDVSPALSYGQTYVVRARARVNGTYDSLGSACTVITVDQAMPPTTQLRPFDCGRQDVPVTDYLIANFVPAAETYRFLITQNGNVVRDVTQDRRRLELGPLLLNFGTVYRVSVDVLRDGIVTQGDSVCQFRTEESLTAVRPGNCGKFYGIIDDKIGAVPIAGADNYEFSFRQNGVEVASGISRGKFIKLDTLQPAIQYGQTYSVTVRAVFANGTMGNYGTACDIYTVSQATPPPTKLRAKDCGRENVDVNGYVIAIRVPAADGYRFYIETAQGEVILDSFQERTKLDLSAFQERLMPATVYRVTVDVTRDRVVTQGTEVCTFKTPFLRTQVASRSCGQPYGLLRDKLFADTVRLATSYRFSYRQNGQEVASSIGNVRGRTKLQTANPALQYGQTYTVFVAPIAGGQLQDYGTGCPIYIIDQPTPPATKLRDYDCGRNVAATGDFVIADRVIVADSYHFYFYEADSTFVFSKLIDFRSRFDLDQAPLQPNTTYLVRVNVLRDNILTPGTVYCPIYVGGNNSTAGARIGATSNATAIEALAAYPNPFTTSFSLEVPELATISILDLQGRTLSSVQGQGNMVLGSSLQPGTYLVRVATASGTQTLRMTKAAR